MLFKFELWLLSNIQQCQHSVHVQNVVLLQAIYNFYMHTCMSVHTLWFVWQLIQVLIWFQSSNLHPRLRFTVIRQNSKFAIIFRLLVNQSSCSIFSRTLYDRLCLFCGLLEEPGRGLDLCTFWNCAPKNSLPANYMHKNRISSIRHRGTIFFAARFCAATILEWYFFLWKAHRHQWQLDRVCASDTLTTVGCCQ